MAVRGRGGRAGLSYCCGVLRPVALRRQLAGAAPIGAGLLILGVSAYVVLGIAGHALAPRDYAAVASLYLLVAIVGPGVFIAVEQETNREVSSRTAAGVGSAPARRAAWTVSTGLAAAVSLLLLALSPVLVPRAFGGSWALLGAAVVAVAGTGAVNVVRGVLGGEQRRIGYAVSLGAEGTARILPCVVLGLVGGAGTVEFGFAFALGTGIATLIGLPALGRAAAGPPVDFRRTARRTVLLAMASGLTYVVTNTAPLVLTARLPDTPELAASFVSLFVLARIPIFLFGPVQMFLLPSLVAGAERADAAHITARLRVALLAVTAVGLVGAAAAALLGPCAARVFFDAPVDLPPVVAVLLVLSTVATMAAQVLQPALVALQAHRTATVAWLSGTAVFTVLLFLPGDPVRSALAAQVVAPVVVGAVMAAAVHAALRRLPAQTR